MPLVIYGVRGHTHTRTRVCIRTCSHESDFKKPDAAGWLAPGLKMWRFLCTHMDDL